MRKTIFRTLAMLMAVLMLTFAFASCKKTEEAGSEETTAAPTEVASGDESTDKPKKTEAVLPEVNYNGYEFNILSRPVDACKFDLVVEEPVSSVDEKVWEREQFIWETFGVDLVMNVSSSENTNTDTSAMNSILSSACEYDLISTHGRSAWTYALNNCGYNWYDLKWVDLDETDWWCQGAVDNWTVNGKVFCMVGDISYVNVGQANCMYFNKDHLDAVDIAYPYDDVIAGTWTLEKMKNIALEAYAGMTKSGTGSIENDSFAYTSGHWRGAMQLYYSTGNLYVTGNSTETLKLTGYKESIQDAYTAYIDNFLAKAECYRGATKAAAESYGTMQKAFINDRVVFYDDLIEESVQFNQEVNFGIVPFPKANADVEGYPTLVNAYSNVFVVPLNIADAERTSVVLEAMAFYGFKNIVPEYYDEVLSYKTSPDAQATQVLQLIRKYFVYDLGYYNTLGGLGDIGMMCYDDGTAAGMQGYYTALETEARNKLTELDKLK